ncbi:Adenylyl cyclase class-3/4/guanylyl cyclase [Candidatus Nitrosarchaeum limnium SFB1]|jgi:adenylate cyclase|uniref:Adenylyl cyclase class-3/4/guanylyl cyclase n=1 Tax=Candidatus Nitrosarchaeum limnium SFB1 TaxID=886738 RepID=F3KKQ4_9ARCH|nr:Adenylyl cyclase class-3/4/guanylyl cyclase [Candidatus Nitrosarchaeum limnium SFB1]
MTQINEIRFGDFLLSKGFFDYSSIDIQSKSQKISLYENHQESIMQPSDYLVAFSTQTKRYCVGCVDMVNSTKIATHLTQKQLTVYYEMFLNSMSKIIGRFGGRVIKNVGDCLLYYFSDLENSQEIMKKCLDCGISMTVAQPIICKQLESKGLPRLDYRVSMDYGPVIIMNTSDSASIDLIGPPVNICAKINRCANKNEFVIGGDLKEIVKKIEGYKFEQTIGYNVGLPRTYPVYTVNRK